MRKKALVLVGLSAIMLVVSVYAFTTLLVLDGHVYVSEVYGLTAWKDSFCTVPLSEMEFGVLNVSSSQKTLSFWLKSTANLNQTLHCSTSGLSPYFSFNWTREGFVLQAYDTVSCEATLKLLNSSALAGGYDFSVSFERV